MSEKIEKHDPIKQDPLREPGQSGREQLNEVVYELACPWFVLAVFAFLYAVFEWLRWSVNFQPAPVFVSLVAVAIAVIAAWKIWKLQDEIHNRQLGIRGEKYTGQYLQAELLPKGYVVIHDIPGDGYNIDHALVGPGGVFAIETKTRRKRKGDARVDYDGQVIKVDGVPVRDNPLGQVQAAARQLQQALLEGTGSKVSVRPVVLYPRWYVNKQPSGVETWVLNEKGLVAFVDNEPAKMSSEEIIKFAAAICRYVRDQEKQLTK